MKKNNLLKDYVRMSCAVGKRVDYVQGGGGNTSVKINNTEMLIKASGYLLANITSSSGFSVVNYKKLLAYICEKAFSEEDLENELKSSVVQTSNKPSIETGFHALLGKFVLHTHSVYANVLTCATEGKNIIRDLFPNAGWIDYVSPGMNLTNAIKTETRDKGNIERIIFLQNHGLIVCSNDAQEALEIHEEVNDKIRKEMKLRKFTKRAVYEHPTATEVLFPDQIVYGDRSDHEPLDRPAKETISAFGYISRSIKECGLAPNFPN